MNEYIFYTFEGYTESPTGKECENIQLLGFEFGRDRNEAKQTLVRTREWIEEFDFDVEEIEAKQLLTDENKKDIRAVIDYLWNNEKKHFEEECGIEINDDGLDMSKLEKLCPNHIFCIINKLKAIVS